MQVLVVGGTGTVGSHVVGGLLARGVTTSVLVRSEDRAAQLPRGARAIVGNLERRETLPRAFQGAGAVFLLNPLSQNETEMGMAAVHAAVAGGAGRLVYLAVPIPPGSEHIPHLASKIPVIEALRSSGIGWTILRPSNFFQNDYWVKDALLQYGTYPLPIGSVGIERVDVRDIADVAVAALTDDGHAGQEYEIVGPQRLTGQDVAAAWSRALGREVRYGGDDLDVWQQAASGTMPSWLVHDLRLMYSYFQQNGLPVSDGALERQERIMGHPARDFDAFARETAAAWRDERGPEHA